MSRRQSVPANVFYRRADPLPPLFPEPHPGDVYFNTTRNVLRIYQEVKGSDPVTLLWQDLFYAAADHTHPSVVSYTWTYDTPTTMADPGTGKIRTNTAAGTPATQIAFSDLTDGGIDASPVLMALKAGSELYFQQKNQADNWGRYSITGNPTNNGAWVLVPVEGVEDHGTAINKNQSVLIRFVYGSGGGGGGDSGIGTDEFWKKWTGTQSQYDNIASKNRDTLYVITD